ncbi:hypothetical protein [Roseobacter litoralis]|uniref:hypothetical protein n=1 Tax=Roseobacter litoralis TaxID=42443 RepID=UPI002491FEF2|nr:hypothetical protein [Roseobacter litoralis]
MQIALIILSFLFSAFSALAIDLEYLLEDEAPRYYGIPDETEFYATRTLVRQMRGIVSGGRVQFVVDGSSVPVSAISLDTGEFNGKHKPCIRYGSECFNLSNALSPESIVRVAHWAYQGKFKAFSCIERNDRGASDLKNSGLIDLGTTSIAKCGNEFIAPELNSPQLRAMARHIDFGDGPDFFADLNNSSLCTIYANSSGTRSGASTGPLTSGSLADLLRERQLRDQTLRLDPFGMDTDLTGELLERYPQIFQRLNDRSPIILSPPTTAVVDSTWVNMDLSEIYKAELIYAPPHQGGSFIVFSTRPERHLWELERVGPAKVLKKCRANAQSDVNVGNRANQNRAIRFFQVAAVIRTLGENKSRGLAAEINRQIDAY